MKIQIVGSGSAGMHFLRAAELIGAKDITVVDNNAAMLDSLQARYLERYKKPAPLMALTKNIHGADVTIIATPPDTHLFLAEQADDRSTHIIIEKPICAPGQFGRLLGMRWRSKVWVNYQYVLHPALAWLKDSLPRIASPIVGHVRWMESSDFCAKAHPWSPAGWYLFDSKRGGGASSEHSHGLAMWILALASSTRGSLQSTWHKMAKDDYDTFSQFMLAVTDASGHVPLVGSVCQDFLAREPVKDMTFSCEEVTAYVNFITQAAAVYFADGTSKHESFNVTREEEFTLLLKHIQTADYDESPLALHNVLPVQEVLSSHSLGSEQDEPQRVH